MNPSGDAWLTLPAQPFDATPFSAFIQPCFREGSIFWAVLGRNPARAFEGLRHPGMNERTRQIGPIVYGAVGVAK